MAQAYVARDGNVAPDQILEKRLSGRVCPREDRQLGAPATSKSNAATGADGVRQDHCRGWRARERLHPTARVQTHEHRLGSEHAVVWPGVEQCSESLREKLGRIGGPGKGGARPGGQGRDEQAPGGVACECEVQGRDLGKVTPWQRGSKLSHGRRRDLGQLFERHVWAGTDDVDAAEQPRSRIIGEPRTKQRRHRGSQRETFWQAGFPSDSPR